ncbi:MAG: alanine racemase [Gammaproteobacteria bacterium]|nr:MAG: alanine racemase [Gammaproteobacteria bacterium]
MITATAVIDSQALLNNYQQIKKQVPQSKILAVLKANGYGHGLERIAKLLSKNTNTDAFGVARLDEALLLRAAGIVQPIVLLEGVFNQADLPIVAVNDLQIVIHNKAQLDALIKITPKKLLNKQIKVWLKIDTGMHRLGIASNDFDYFYQQLQTSNNVQTPITLMSHLACADDQNNNLTNIQLALFEQLTSHLNEPKSCANSAGICAWQQSHYDWLRPGLMLYGVSPLLNADHDRKNDAKALAIKPVMTLQASLIALRQVNAGESVGYGANWTSKQHTTIGIIAIGYGDGYPRHAENGTPVLINDRIVPLVGRVAMDMITVDLGHKSIDRIGDIATLWGKGLPVEVIAKHASTIAYELLCNIKPRVQITVH